MKKTVQTNQPKKLPDPLMSCRAVEEHFDIAACTRIAWTRRGILRAYRIAGRVYYKVHDIEATLREVQSTSNEDAS